MKTPQRTDPWSRLLILLLVLFPLMLLLLAPGTAFTSGTLVFWLALLGCFLVILFMLGMPEAELAPGRDLGPRMLAEGDQPDAVKAVMTINVATEGIDGVRIVRGRLPEPADAVYQKLRRAFRARLSPCCKKTNMRERRRSC